MICCFLWVSALRYHILSVFFRGSEEEMIWSHTNWIVTLVTYKKPIGDRPEVKFPREPMGVNSPAVIMPSPKSSVARSVLSRFPKPAFVSLLNFDPKPFGWWTISEVLISAFSRTDNAGAGGERLGRSTAHGTLYPHRNYPFRCHGEGRFQPSPLLYYTCGKGAR